MELGYKRMKKLFNKIRQLEKAMALFITLIIIGTLLVGLFIPFNDVDVDIFKVFFNDIESGFSGPAQYGSDNETQLNDEHKIAAVSASVNILFTILVCSSCLAFLLIFRKILAKENSFQRKGANQSLRNGSSSGIPYKSCKESEKHYRELISNQGEGMGIVDTDENFVFANVAAEKIFNVGMGELIGRNLQEFLSEEQMELVLRQTQNRKKGKNSRYEFVIDNPEGEPRYIQLTATPRYNLEKKVIGAYGIFRDITEQKMTEKAVRESEKRYRRLTENAQDMIWRTNLNGKVLYVNNYVKHFLGYDPDEAIDKPLEKYFTEESIITVTNWVKDALSSSPPKNGFNGEVAYIHKKGHLVPGELRVKFEYDEKGAVVALDGVSRDISSRKKAEMEKMKLEEQLRQSQKMEAIGRLAGGIAHDFNNLLTGILGYAEMAIASLDEENPVADDILEIQRAAERAGALTQQLLAFSRKQIIVPKIINLNKTIANSKKMLSRIIGEDIILRFLPEKNIFPIKADEGQIDQILVNLAVNAKDAMNGGGKLTIATSNVVSDETFCKMNSEFIPGNYVLLSVSDNGCGIAQNVQGRIFEPFFSTKEEVKGTGLGLSTVYGIVKQNNSYIYVYSEPDVGTTFKIYFPSAKNVKDKQKSATDKTLPTGDETILLVENEQMVRGITEEILKGQGYTVLKAQNGKEGNKICLNYKDEIDLLISDVVMPNMNGRELFEQLKRIKPGIKVLFMSGYTKDVIDFHGVLNKDIPFLGKPFTLRDLSNTVRSILDEKKMPQIVQKAEPQRFTAFSPS